MSNGNNEFIKNNDCFTHGNYFAHRQLCRNKNFYLNTYPKKSNKKGCLKKSPLNNRSNLSPSYCFYNPYLHCNSFSMHYPQNDFYQSENLRRKKSKNSVKKLQKKCTFSKECSKEQKQNDIENCDKEFKSYKKRKKGQKIVDINIHIPPNANTNHIHQQSTHFNKQNHNALNNQSSFCDKSSEEYETYDFCENDFSYAPISSTKDMLDVGVSRQNNSDHFNDTRSLYDFSDTDIIFDRSPINNFNFSDNLYDEIHPKTYLFENYIEPTSHYYCPEYYASDSAYETCENTKNDQPKERHLPTEIFKTSDTSPPCPCQYTVYLSATPPHSPVYKTFTGQTSPTFNETPMKTFPNVKERTPRPQYSNRVPHACNDFLSKSPIGSLLQPNSEFIKCLNLIIRKHVKRQVTRHVTNTIGSGFLKNNNHSPVPQNNNKSFIKATDTKTGDIFLVNPANMTIEKVLRRKSSRKKSPRITTKEFHKAI